MKQRVERLVDEALAAARAAGEIDSPDVTAEGSLEVPKERQHGDLATNLAMTMARSERKAPRAIAEILVRHLQAGSDLIRQVEIAGPGFINFHLSDRFWQEELSGHLSDSTHGVPEIGKGTRVQVEFVSANPTGPLTVGHGRNAVLGDTIARVLEATGHDVQREYYFNNAGRQMKVLGESVRARYLELLDRPSEFPEDGYQGDYIRDIAQGLIDREGDAVDGSAGNPFRDAAEQSIFEDIRATQKRLGIVFDNYFNEDSLYAEGAIEDVVEKLDEKGVVVRKDGAVWLAGEAVGLPKDRVLVKSTGEPAYRLPDIAYHRNKLSRNFDRVITVLGADHIEEHREVVAGLRALGHEADKVQAVIYQFVTLTRLGEQVKMSTRKAEYVTLDELVDEVGIDAVRFFFLSRKSDSHLEFDLELAKKRSTDNPVYYVQYAHARICNLFAQARERGIAVPEGDVSLEALAPLGIPEEVELIRAMTSFGETVGGAARDLEPHRVVFYLQDLAAALHRFYNQHRVLGDDAQERIFARLCLLEGVRRTVAAGLSILGIEAPERM